jgi:uncharacterized Zn-binding protein involved in type VI secretion
MSGASRLGDANSMGGTILKGASTVFINGQPAGLHVSQITPHAPWGRKVHPPHSASKTTEGSPSVFVEGQALLRIGSGTTCGHPIVGGSSDVFCP